MLFFLSFQNIVVTDTVTYIKWKSSSKIEHSSEWPWNLQGRSTKDREVITSKRRDRGQCPLIPTWCLSALPYMHLCIFIIVFPLSDTLIYPLTCWFLWKIRKTYFSELLDYIEVHWSSWRLVILENLLWFRIQFCTQKVCVCIYSSLQWKCV